MAKENDAQKETDSFIVKYKQNYYNITEFMHKHPGGITTLKGLNNADMTGRFMKAPPHSDAAMYLMKEYKIKTNAKHAHTNGHNGLTKVQKENGIELIEEEDRNDGHLDESMEYLVDWSKAMVPQIPNITKHYDEWVHKPVDRPLRLFGPWYLEMCTKTPWWVVPTFWIPVIVKCILNEFLDAMNAANIEKLIYLIGYFIVGILFWTLLEYALHRWVFHMKINSNTNIWLCTFHFMIHGLHHKVPFDPLRLVFPPLPGALICTIIYTPISFLVPTPHVLLSGALFGYLCYDMMHYYLHYGSPTMRHMYHMKRYHYQHHFAHQNMGYGISSPLWDFIFDTRIHLRKLKFQLRWK
ncbi:dihydroceramide fatty acyl 2-hydroxylase FAH2 [Teleopsis dalmanni]|uniref:dihydroceramide fatty acyl 2-hydroxylase FAH2-like n=1 Tax=Teleopsis dalmanni TaxID=139649 RepID=UPI0018CE1858|nr:dihydroceramide fatty acyl 2-hydroxylase FAH2-like [Teleopsis dalmanni]XP_037951751.1 dihydroceramide fatty acyl 2-hydroxylase FAH2 [Teleopsis dalmanni]